LSKNLILLSMNYKIIRPHLESFLKSNPRSGLYYFNSDQFTSFNQYKLWPERPPIEEIHKQIDNLCLSQNRGEYLIVENRSDQIKAGINGYIFTLDMIYQKKTNKFITTHFYESSIKNISDSTKKAEIISMLKKIS